MIGHVHVEDGDDRQRNDVQHQESHHHDDFRVLVVEPVLGKRIADVDAHGLVVGDDHDVGPHGGRDGADYGQEPDGDGDAQGYSCCLAAAAWKE